MLNVWFFLILALLLFFIRRFQNRRFFTKLSQFDGPPSLPFLGNSLMLRHSPSDSFKIVNNWLKQYSSCYVFWLFTDPYVVTSRREDVQAIRKMHHKAHLYKFFKDSLGTGLVVSNGEKWKKSRVLVEKVFATTELTTNILHIFNQQSCFLVDEIRKTGMGMEFNIWPLILKILTRTISEIIIGSTETSNLSLSRGYGSGKKRCEVLIVKRMYSPWLYPEFMFKLYLILSGQSQIFETVRAPFVKAIQNRKQILAFEKITAPDGTSQPSRKPILDNLMDSNELSDKELTDEIMTLMFAASDTTATALCFTLLMLAMNQNVQEKVYEEINEVFTATNEPANISNIHKLIFLEQCIKETLRKYPSVPIIVRRAVTDVTLSDGLVVPAGANVVLSIQEIHNNPEFYPNPEVWNPHNFDPDKVNTQPINTFIPFAVGPRACVGYKYAMLAMKVFLLHILRNFKLSTTQRETKINVNIVIKCTSGYHIKFERREKTETLS